MAVFSFPILQGSDDLAGIYNILYRYLFDRHRDLGLPTSFLISGSGEIVKIYQGPVNPEHVEQDFRQHSPNRRGENGESAAVSGGKRYFGISSQLSQLRLDLFSAGISRSGRSVFSAGPARRSGERRGTLRFGKRLSEARKNRSEARASFERAIKLQASYPDTLANAWNNLGLLATREGHTAEAIPYFPGGVEAESRSPDCARESGERLPATEELGRGPQSIGARGGSRPAGCGGELQPGNGLRATQRHGPGLRVSAAGIEVPPRIIPKP